MKPLTVPEILKQLEKEYGPQLPSWPTEPYEFLVWWHCGYPQSDDRCSKGWAALTAVTAIDPASLLETPMPKLNAALKAGGMVPELRAQRLKEVASRVINEFGGDLRDALTGPIEKVRKTLRSFPNIGDPGTDRILLFAGLAAIPAVPSNCPHVLVRIRHGMEHKNYGRTYREAQQAIENEVAKTREARMRAYLLLKTHGQKVCKMKPRCELCPLHRTCAFGQGKWRGRAALLES